MGRRSTLLEQLKRLRDQRGGSITLNELIEQGVPKWRPRKVFFDDSMIDIYVEVECARRCGLKITDACKKIGKFRKVGWQVIYKRHREAGKHMRHPDHEQHLQSVVEHRLRNNPKLANFLRK